MYGVLIAFILVGLYVAHVISSRQRKLRQAEQDHLAAVEQERLQREIERQRVENSQNQARAQFQAAEPREMIDVVEDLVALVGIPEENVRMLSAFMIIVSAIYQAGYQDGGQGVDARVIDFHALNILRPADRKNQALTQEDMTILRYINELYHLGYFDACNRQQNRALVLAKSVQIDIRNVVDLSQRFNHLELHQGNGG